MTTAIENPMLNVDTAGGASACWPWLGAHTTHGYGQWWSGKSRVQAHRVIYELIIGPIPDGLQIDHLCRNRICVNPAHLEPVTPRENVMRADTPSTRNAAKTHCIRGHEFSEQNTLITQDGRRQCRACHNARGARPRAKRSAV